MRAIAEYSRIDGERFEREIVPKGEPAVLRGLVADWPATVAARQGDEALAEFLRGAASEEPFEAWFGPPEIEGRFGYNDDFSGFNHERKLATVDQLLDLLLRQRGHERPYSMYAGGIPIRRHLPGLLPTVPVPLLDTSKATLISLWLGNRTRTAAHWDLPQNLACLVGGRRRFTLFRTDQLPNLYSGRSISRWQASRSAWSISRSRISRSIHGSPRRWMPRSGRSWSPAMPSTCRACGGTRLPRSTSSGQ
jgi:hypothetical protein